MIIRPYAEQQAQWVRTRRIEQGDFVYISRPPDSFTDPQWPGAWTPKMSDQWGCIGRVVEIGPDGISLAVYIEGVGDCAAVYQFPYFILQKVVGFSNTAQAFLSGALEVRDPRLDLPPNTLVLVRDHKNEEWRVAYFRKQLPHTNLYKCAAPYRDSSEIVWRCCIPFEGNEEKAGKVTDA